MNNISNQTFHTISRLSFLIIALFAISTLTGCDDNTIWIWDSAETKAAKRARIEEKKKKDQEWINTVVGNVGYIASDELIALLSVKYTIEENVSIKILGEYEEKAQKLHTGNIAKLLDDLNEKSNNTDTKKNQYRELLITLAKNNGITTDIVASVIMDYKWLNKIND